MSLLYIPRVVCLKRAIQAWACDGFNAWTDTSVPRDRTTVDWFGPAQLTEFLTQCDHIVVTVSSTIQSEATLVLAQLALWSHSPHHIVIARSGLVDESVRSRAPSFNLEAEPSSIAR